MTDRVMRRMAVIEFDETIDRLHGTSDWKLTPGSGVGSDGCYLDDYIQETLRQKDNKYIRNVRVIMVQNQGEK